MNRSPSVEFRYRYGVYGIDIASDRPLALPGYARAAFCRVECVGGEPSIFLSAIRRAAVDPRTDSWYRYARLDDGSTYVGWTTVGEFLVAADGRRIACRAVERSSDESFQVYLLGQALSCALVQQGFEPLHATAVVVDGRAVAFLGSNAFGKSTLAACFVAAGHRLLTDDLLLTQHVSSLAIAYPGPPRIKLFPKVAGRFLRSAANGVAMNPDTEKVIVPLGRDRHAAVPVPLHAIYTLAGPRDACRQPHISIEPISPRRAFFELIGNTFNRRLAGAQRTGRQFTAMARLADAVPIKRLIFPRALDRLGEVREAVLDDLDRDARSARDSSEVNPSLPA